VNAPLRAIIYVCKDTTLYVKPQEKGV